MTINDLLANTVGKIGENIVLKKVYGIVADPDIMLSGYTHPKGKFVTSMMNLKNERLIDWEV